MKWTLWIGLAGLMFSAVARADCAGPYDAFRQRLHAEADAAQCRRLDALLDDIESACAAVNARWAADQVAACWLGVARRYRDTRGPAAASDLLGQTPRSHPAISEMLGDLALQQGQPDRASRYFSQAFDMATQPGQESWRDRLRLKNDKAELLMADHNPARPFRLGRGGRPAAIYQAERSTEARTVTRKKIYFAPRSKSPIARQELEDWARQLKKLSVRQILVDGFASQTPIEDASCRTPALDLEHLDCSRIERIQPQQICDNERLSLLRAAEVACQLRSVLPGARIVPTGKGVIRLDQLSTREQQVLTDGVPADQRRALLLGYTRRVQIDVELDAQ